jgi:hypothetical protein
MENIFCFLPFSLVLETKEGESCDGVTRGTVKCGICLKKSEDNDDEASQKILKCQHTFHKKCIDKWSNITSTCPTCRVHA